MYSEFPYKFIIQGDIMGFEINGLDEMTEALSMVQKVYPKEVKKFMQSEGNKLKKQTKSKAKSSVNKKTGNFYCTRPSTVS